MSRRASRWSNAVSYNFSTKEKAPKRICNKIRFGASITRYHPNSEAELPFVSALTGRTPRSNRLYAVLLGYSEATFIHGARALTPTALSLVRPMYYSSSGTIYFSIYLRACQVRARDNFEAEIPHAKSKTKSKHPCYAPKSSIAILPSGLSVSLVNELGHGIHRGICLLHQGIDVELRQLRHNVLDLWLCFRVSRGKDCAAILEG